MKKLSIILGILTIVVLSFLNVNAKNTPQGLKQPHELDYGVWSVYSCGSICTWSRCEPGDGNCTYEDQSVCPC